MLTNQGIPRQLPSDSPRRRTRRAVAKVLLNAFYLQSQGKLQNGPGYIRAGIEDGYELLPQVAHRLENRRRELEERIRRTRPSAIRLGRRHKRAAEEAAITMVIDRLTPGELDDMVRQAVALLPEPIVRRNPTLSNPFVRGKVYELACGEPMT